MNTANQNQGTIDQKASSSSSSSSTSSSSSSSSDEFSFTISLHPSSSSSSSKPETPNDKTINQSPLTIDLSPADDIFFHGHLLPLSLLSHIPVSPRTSTTSKPLLPPQETSTNNNNDNKNTRVSNLNLYSLFNPSKLRKGFAFKSPERGESETNRKKMMRKIAKGYSRMVKPVVMMFRRSEKGEGTIRNAGFCSYSGDLRSSRRRDQGMRLGGLISSAPVSLKTSPSNSGLLVPTKSLSSSSSSKQSDSTTEEIQAAIQAAIAHCKNSFAVEEKIK